MEQSRNYPTKKEIENSISDKGDFIQIDYLLRVLKKDLPYDIRKFIYNKLVRIYNDKRMFSESAKIYEKLAESSVTFRDKIDYFIKEAEALIRAGNYDLAEKCISKACGNANELEKREIYNYFQRYYVNLAKEYEVRDRRSNAIEVYERALQLNLREFEKEEINKRLKVLYEKTGRFREYFNLKTR
jgi:tetratricopeptide (TPR) repeat protein